MSGGAISFSAIWKTQDSIEEPLNENETVMALDRVVVSSVVLYLTLNYVLLFIEESKCLHYENEFNLSSLMETRKVKLMLDLFAKTC